MSIAVVVNPHSQAIRRRPGTAAELAAWLGDGGRVIAPTSLDELALWATRLREERPSVIAVHGGDGTLHKTITALLCAWGDDPLPPLALLGGGTMNVVAASLGIRTEPRLLLESLVGHQRLGRTPPTLRRRCMRVGDKYGFVFGNGLVANFLEEYYSPRGYGPRRALWLLLRCLASALWRGPFARKIFRRFRGRLTIDGSLLERDVFVAVSAATVREVGLGFKFNHRADDDPDRFSVLAIHAGPLALAQDLVAVRAGRGISPARASSALASSIDIEPAEKEMPYTIDGDLYRGSGILRIAIGPAVEFVAAPARPAGAPLLPTTGGDSIDGAP